MENVYSSNFSKTLEQFFTWANESGLVIKGLKDETKTWDFALMPEFKEPGRNKLENYLKCIIEKNTIYEHSGSSDEIDDIKIIVQRFKDAPKKKTNVSKTKKSTNNNKKTPSPGGSESDEDVPSGKKTKKTKKSKTHISKDEPMIEQNTHVEETLCNEFVNTFSSICEKLMKKALVEFIKDYHIAPLTQNKRVEEKKNKHNKKHIEDPVEKHDEEHNKDPIEKHDEKYNKDPIEKHDEKHDEKHSEEHDDDLLYESDFIGSTTCTDDVVADSDDESIDLDKLDL